MTKNKYLPDDDDIPSDFNLGKSRAQEMLDNIKKSRAPEDNIDDDTYQVAVVEEKKDTLELDDDFETARQNIKDLLEVSAAAIKEYFKMATTSESPKAMDVLSNMIKDTVDMNKSFIDIHQQKERINSTKINNGNPISHEAGNTQNNITSQTNIVCSPGDLVKMLQDAQSSNVVDVQAEPVDKK